MGIYIIKNRICKGQERFLFETDDEIKILENARRFFHTSYLFLSEGLGRNIEKSSAGTMFHAIKIGGDYRGYKRTISLKEFALIEHYEKLYKRGGRYNPETFEIPVIE